MRLEYQFHTFNDVMCVCFRHAYNFWPTGEIVYDNEEVVSSRDLKQVYCDICPWSFW